MPRVPDQSSGIGVTGIIVIAVIGALFLVLIVYGNICDARARKKALKGRWASWADTPRGRDSEDPL